MYKEDAEEKALFGIRGIGVHSGKECAVHFYRSEERQENIAFFRKGNFVPFWIYPEGAVFFDIDWHADYATHIHWDEDQLSTPEHLLAALLPFAHWPLDVVFTGPEVPVADGSAQIWRTALEELGKTELKEYAEKWDFVPAPADFIWEESGAFVNGAEEREWRVRVESSDHFSIHYQLRQSGLECEAFFNPAKNVRDERLWKARTFIREDNWIKAKEQGLLKGAHEGHGILYRPHYIKSEEMDILSGAPLRFPAEPAWHKVLDFLGDLALSGAEIPTFKVSVINGGHWLHHKCIERIRNA
jgi:UDP-3-O-acyl-N-acetylglucosamine deacetylase